MAGLSAAWMLSRKGFRVTVFEKGSRPGLSAHSRDFASCFPGVEHAIHGDVPSRMFNDSLWPTLTQLYRDAGIETEAVDNGQTFYSADDVLLKIKLPYSTSILKNVLNPVARQLVGSLATFQKYGIAALKDGHAEIQTFGEYLDRQFNDTQFEQFLNCFLFPALTSTVFTCAKSDLLNYPCPIVLQAMNRITDSVSPLMRTANGSESAARSLLKDVEAVHFDSAVQQVTTRGDAVAVHVDGQPIMFDHCIVATQANHASTIVANELSEESELLKQFRYVDVPIQVHTDSSILPDAKSDWTTFNFDTANQTSATCTVWMNRFHSTWPESNDVFHSIFPGKTIDAEKVLFATTMQRPVVDAMSQTLLSELDAIHSHERRIWFAGSYAAPGVPLLESAVQSSVGMVEKITAAMLWKSA